MKIETSGMKDLALAWAVAQCEGYRGVESLTKPDPLDDGALEHRWLRDYSPSTNWAHGGPIIEREGVSVERVTSALWDAYLIREDKKYGGIERIEADGPTPLIAAMRCYVASRLGDEVEVPDALCE